MDHRSEYSTAIVEDTALLDPLKLSFHNSGLQCGCVAQSRPMCLSYEEYGTPCLLGPQPALGEVLGGSWVLLGGNLRLHYGHTVNRIPQILG